MDYYLNLPLQLRHVLSAIDLINNPPPTYIYFKEYFDVMNTTFQIDESCNNSDENLIPLKNSMEDLKHLHMHFCNEFIHQIDHYWFQHEYWRKDLNNVKLIKATGMFIAELRSILGDSVIDLGKVSQKLCSVCNDIIDLKNLNAHATICIGCSFYDITSLCEGWNPTRGIDFDILRQLTVYPDQINEVNVQSLILSLQTTSNLIMNNDLSAVIKSFLMNKERHCATPPGVIEVLIKVITIGTSEAVAETIGSVMEKYHKERYTYMVSGSDER